MDTFTTEGNLTRDPELKHTASGRPVVNFSIASDFLKGEVNGEREKHTSFYDFEAWGTTAENVAKLTKGDRVVVVGRFRQDRWEQPVEGQTEPSKRSKIRFQADAVGASLRWAKVSIERTNGNGNGAGNNGDAGGDFGEEPF